MTTHSSLHNQPPGYATYSSGGGRYEGVSIPLPITNVGVKTLNLPTMLSMSVLLHILTIAAIYFTLLILQFLGFSIPIFEPPALKARDIEFVLVENPEAKPINKNTTNRADRATRSGGKAIKNMPKVETQRAAGAKASKPKPAAPPSPSPKPRAAQQQPRVSRPSRPAQPNRPAPKPQPQQPKVQVTEPPTPQTTPQPKKAPPAPKRPDVKVTSDNTAPKPAPRPGVIKMPAPSAPSPVSAGPVVRTPSASGSPGGSSGSSGSRALGPSQIPGSVSGPSGSGNPGSPGSAGSPGGAGGSGRYNQAGSPGGGGGRAGVDALPEPDFGPYISELQRRIKRNWNPPSDNRNKRIVALFTVDRNGQLVNIRIQQSSGVQVADDAAIMAVRASSPFRRLPPNYRGNTIDIQFIFDYNVYTGKGNVTYN